MVGLIRLRPLQYKGHSSADGKKFILEAVLKVLSSQHEDSRFRIQFRATEKGQASFGGQPLTCYTEPIQVISKPEVLQPKVQGSRKRTRNDLVLEKLAALESRQKKYQEDLQARLSALSNVSSHHAPKSWAQAPLEDSFLHFLNIFYGTPARERVEVIRHVMRLSPHLAATTAQLTAIIGSEMNVDITGASPLTVVETTPLHEFADDTFYPELSECFLQPHGSLNMDVHDANKLLLDVGFPLEAD